MLYHKFETEVQEPNQDFPTTIVRYYPATRDEKACKADFWLQVHAVAGSQVVEVSSLTCSVV